MPKTGQRSIWNSIKYIITGTLIISLLWYIWTIPFDDILATIQRIGWAYFLVFLTTAMAYSLGTMAWQKCLPATTKHVSFFELFGIRLMGENVAVINPTNFIGGESAKIWLLQKKGISYAEGTSSILLSRAILISTQVLLFIIAAIYFMVKNAVVHDALLLIIAASVGIIFLAIVVFFLIKNSQFFQSRISKYPNLNKLQSTIQEAIELIKVQFQYKKTKLLFAIIYSTAHWIVGAMEIWLLFYFLGYDITLFDAVLMDMGIVLIKSFGGFVPGQIGVEEYANKLLFAVVGMTNITVWMTISILRRFRQLVWMGIGLGWYLLSKNQEEHHQKTSTNKKSHEHSFYIS